MWFNLERKQDLNNTILFENALDVFSEVGEIYFSNRKKTKIDINEISISKVNFAFGKNNEFYILYGHFSMGRNRELRFYTLEIEKASDLNVEKYLKFENNLSERPRNSEIMLKFEEIAIALKEKWINVDSKAENFRVEWNSFLEPYTYYWELKEYLLTKKFWAFSNFDNEIIKIIKIDIDSNYFDQYKNNINENDIWMFKTNAFEFLAINYEKYKRNFDFGFLKNNTMYFSSSKNELDKENIGKHNREIRKANEDLKNEGLVFIQSKNKFKKSEITLSRIENYLKRNDKKINPETIFIDESYEENSKVDLKYSLFFNIIQKLNIMIKEKFEILNEINIDKNKKLVDSFLENLKKLLNDWRDLKKDLKSNFKEVIDEEKEDVNEIFSFDIDVFSDILIKKCYHF